MGFTNIQSTLYVGPQGLASGGPTVRPMAGLESLGERMKNLSTVNTWSVLALAGLFALSGFGQALPSPTPQSPEVLEAETPDKLLIRAEDWLKQYQEDATAPDFLDFNGIRPGQLILTTIPGQGTFICSLSFIFKAVVDGVTEYYAGTAGHCLLPPTAVATHNAAVNYNASGVSVSVCRTNCYLGGQLSGWLATMTNLGPVVYARQTNPSSSLACPAGDIGNDFGLIKIRPILYDPAFAFVRTDMAVWGGPYGSINTEGTGNTLVHYGNGIQAGTAIPTKARIGVSLNDGISCSFQAIAAVAGGDSGSAISFGGSVHDSPLGGEQALGTITHALLGQAPPAFGTTVARGISMVKTDMNRTITLCDATTTIPGC